MMLSFGIAHADEIAIPRWVADTYQYVKDDQVTAREFEDALEYLGTINVIKLRDSGFDIITEFVLTNFEIEGNDRSELSQCSSGWYITGYYAPREIDHFGKMITVTIDGAEYKFREDFVEEIKIEGWGQAVSGEYLGWYDNSFHLSEHALDAHGNKLEVNAIAVDPRIIPANSRIAIPSLPPPWTAVTFTGSDTGTAIIGKHIDVYTGEGVDALEEAYRITGHSQVVCMVSQ